MPPDPVGRRERSRARPPLLGARRLLAPFGRCAAPMPPDPVGQARRLSAPASTRAWGGRSRPPRARDNSRAAPTAAGLGASRRRPPPALGVGVLARRAPGTTHARLPPRGARRLSAPASTRVWGGRSRPPRARDNSRAAPTARGSAPLGAGLHPRLGWAFSPAARPGQLT